MLEEYIKEIVKSEISEQKLNDMYGKNIHELKQENEKLKNILNEIHEICVQTWGEQLPYFEVRRLLNVIRLISENGLNGANDITKNTKQESEKLNGDKKVLKDTLEKSNNYAIFLGQENEKLKQENEKLKKELLDSKNGLNGANHVIKNNKEWIGLQDKKIKELEEEIRLFKSDKEDLEYNLRRKSTQNIQLESKNRFLERENKKLKEKMCIIKGLIHVQHKRTYTNDNLMRTIKLIEDNLKES